MPKFLMVAEAREETRGRLLENLPWSPFDFIRRISKQGDKELFVDSVMRDLRPEDDLRLVVMIDQKKDVLVAAERLRWDSDFFGYGVCKITGIFPLYQGQVDLALDYGDALAILSAQAREKGIKYLTAFIDPRDLPTLRALGRAGYSLIETRLYYHTDLRNYTSKDRHRVRLARVEDIPSLGRTAQEMVNPYDRFHSDPFISPKDADRIMYKWVEASIVEGFADATLVPDVPSPTAFCTVRYHHNEWEKWGLRLAQPVLSAVSSEFKGWYRKLISEVNYHLCEIGAEHAYLATQTTNIPVVRVWESLGYTYGKSEHVFRRII